jgi:serine/threonine-protein kinase
MGLVHRDVSPQNLLVGFDGVTRVTDFGIAKALGRTTRTATGILKGKYGYLSPEQLRFEEPDRRSDVFSLGVVLFELLSGKRLYKNVDGMDGARRILNEPPPDIGEFREDVPDALVELLFSMLAKDPAHRPGTARDVARTLEPIVATLVELEGRMEVSEYLERVFARERVANEAQVSRAIAQATGLTASEEPTASEARRRIAPIALIAGLAIVVIAGGAIAFVAVTSDPVEPAAPSTAARAEIAAPAQVQAPREPAIEEPPAMEELAVEPRPRRPVKRARMTESTGRLPMWEWQR